MPLHSMHQLLSHVLQPPSGTLELSASGGLALGKWNWGPTHSSLIQGLKPHVSSRMSPCLSITKHAPSNSLPLRTPRHRHNGVTTSRPAFRLLNQSLLMKQTRASAENF